MYAYICIYHALSIWELRIIKAQHFLHLAGWKTTIAEDPGIYNPMTWGWDLDPSILLDSRGGLDT